MRLDLDLARHILMTIEDTPYEGLFRPIPIGCPGHDPAVISAHVEHLHHAGLIDATQTPSDGRWHPTDLTPDGHEFLAHSSSPVAWGRARRAGSIAEADRVLWEVICEILDRTEWDCGEP